MCGIVGVVQGKNANFTDKDYNAWMQDAIVAGAVRGADSTGLFQVESPDKNDVFYVHKATDSGYSFISDNFAKGILEDTQKCFLTIGHNRAATRGIVSEENAHPFSHTRNDGSYFVGVHNGTLTSYKTEEDGIKFAVDSDWAIYHLSKGIKEGLKGIHGAYVFVLYDSKDKDKFYIACNGDRPIHWAFVQGHNAMLLASEPEMLMWLARRNRLTIEKNTVFAAQANTLYTFDHTALRSYEKDIIRPAYAAPDRSSHIITHNDFGTWLRKIVTEVRQNKFDENGNRRTPKAKPVELRPNVKAITTDAAVSVTDYTKMAGVTEEELNTLVTGLNINYGRTGEFVPDGWDEVSKQVLGQVSVSDNSDIIELFEASIRGVTKEQWRAMPQDELKVQVIGAFLHERTGHAGGMETQIICRIPRRESISGLVNKYMKDGHTQPASAIAS